MDSPDDACANAEFLLATLDDVTHSIFLSSDACPRTLRYICGCLQKAAVAKWPHERLVRTRVVSGFIFLRLLCPAVLNPRSFNLLPEPPPPHAARSLVMVAKCLQNLANLVEFGGKEPYMEVCTFPFCIDSNLEMTTTVCNYIGVVRFRGVGHCFSYLQILKSDSVGVEKKNFFEGEIGGKTGKSVH